MPGISVPQFCQSLVFSNLVFTHCLQTQRIHNLQEINSWRQMWKVTYMSSTSQTLKLQQWPCSNVCCGCFICRFSNWLILIIILTFVIIRSCIFHLFHKRWNTLLPLRSRANTNWIATYMSTCFACTQNANSKLQNNPVTTLYLLNQYHACMFCVGEIFIHIRCNGISPSSPSSLICLESKYL